MLMCMVSGLLLAISLLVFVTSAHAAAIDPTSQMPVPHQIPPAFAVVDPTSQMPVPHHISGWLLQLLTLPARCRFLIRFRRPSQSLTLPARCRFLTRFRRPSQLLILRARCRFLTRFRRPSQSLTLPARCRFLTRFHRPSQLLILRARCRFLTRFHVINEPYRDVAQVEMIWIQSTAESV